MDVADLVRQHYGGEDLQAGILAALAGGGVDVDHLGVDDLSAVDQLHAGFSDATRYLLSRLGPEPREHGCWTSAAASAGRPGLAAAESGCTVTGVDLSPDFVATATSLTALVGLSDRVGFRVASGDDLGVDRGAFDAAMMVHVGMNIPDKAAVFTDVRRALRAAALRGVRADAGRPRRPALSAALGRGRPDVLRRRSGGLRPRPRGRPASR